MPWAIPFINHTPPLKSLNCVLEVILNLIASEGLRVKFNYVQGVFILDTIKIGKIVPLRNH